MLCETIKNTVHNSLKVDARDGYGPVYLLPVPHVGHLRASYWIIGDYHILKALSTDLRGVPLAQDYVAHIPLRLGLRESDRPPTGEQQESIGGFVRGDDFDKDFTPDRKHELANSAHGGTAPKNRRTDQNTKRLTFWQTRTLQSHHIVEYNHLRDIGVSQPDEKGTGAMDHANLPCVLLAAEFHQKYFTEILRLTRGKGKDGLCQSLSGAYASLYERNGSLFYPLWTAARIILAEAKKTAPTLSLG